MLKLYLSPNSICTQKVLITLDEKSLNYEPVMINLFTNEQYDPEYLKLNPKGVVPTLVHDDHVIPESSLICEYLDEAFPEVSLVRSGPHRPLHRDIRKGHRQPLHAGIGGRL